MADASADNFSGFRLSAPPHTPSTPTPPYEAPGAARHDMSDAPLPLNPSHETLNVDEPSDLFAVPALPSRRPGKRPVTSDTDADADRASSSKRSRQSQNSSNFGSKVKERLTALYGEQCWHCAGLLPQMSHVFTKADGEFAACQRLGLVALGARSDSDNALSLCSSCHYAFDNSPLFIITPFDLDFFLDREQRWQAEYARSPCARIPPTAADYADHCFRRHSSHYTQTGGNARVGGLYNCYMATYFLATWGAQSVQEPLLHVRQWHGDPLAIIWRARKAIHEQAAMPPHLVAVKLKLMQLEMSYDVGNELLRAGPPYLASGVTLSSRPSDDDDEQDPSNPSNRTPLPSFDASRPSPSAQPTPTASSSIPHAASHHQNASQPHDDVTKLSALAQSTQKRPLDNPHLLKPVGANSSRKRQKRTDSPLSEAAAEKTKPPTPSKTILWQYGPHQSTNSAVQRWKRLRGLGDAER